MGRSSPSSFVRFLTGGANGKERIIVDFTTGHAGNFLIEKVGESSKDPTLSLTAQTQQDQVVSGKQSIEKARDHRIFIADDARKKLLFVAKLFNQILSDFVLNRSKAG